MVLLTNEESTTTHMKDYLFTLNDLKKRVLNIKNVFRVTVDKLDVDSPTCMFLGVRTEEREWCVMSLPLETIYKQWDSDFETAVDAVLTQGTITYDYRTIKHIVPCDPSMLLQYKQAPIAG
jgi:hypothetical protein